VHLTIHCVDEHLVTEQLHLAGQARDNRARRTAALRASAVSKSSDDLFTVALAAVAVMERLVRQVNRWRAWVNEYGSIVRRGEFPVPAQYRREERKWGLLYGDARDDRGVTMIARSEAIPSVRGSHAGGTGCAYGRFSIRVGGSRRSTATARRNKRIAEACR